MITRLLALLLFFSTMTAFSQEVDLQLIADEFDDPVDIQNAGDLRMFVVEKEGRIIVISGQGNVLATPFLDIDDLVFNYPDAFDERGFLGLAFHPDYQNNGYFYVNYIDNNGNTQISRYTVSQGDPNLADPSSALPILSINQPGFQHNGGSMTFGPDGYLYISSGDGAVGGDTQNRAQNTTLLLGKILRIDVDNPSGGNNYGIPADNPFAGSTTDAEEIWAYGLRNPWRMSIDFVDETIWIGDVGQADVEEVNRAGLDEPGLNYGWRCYEGTNPFNTTDCDPPGTMEFPYRQYSSSTGSGNCAVLGGYVYRGTRYSDLSGLYFFADTCSGFIRTINSSGTIVDHGNFPGFWTSFGQDSQGELYLVDLNGSIYKIEGGVLATDDVLANSVQLLPNPARDQVTLQTTGIDMDRVTVSNISGQQILSEKVNNTKSHSLQVSGWPAGMYLVQLETTDGQISTKKLMIQN